MFLYQMIESCRVGGGILWTVGRDRKVPVYFLHSDSQLELFYDSDGHHIPSVESSLQKTWATVLENIHIALKKLQVQACVHRHYMRGQLWHQRAQISVTCAADGK